jgi:phosphohistidine phosphatase SixA
MANSLIRFLAFAVLVSFVSAAHADKAGLKALAAGGHVAIVRHALTTSGVGDPPDFKLDRCSTQRNLNDRGRREARRLGRLLRKHKVRIERVLSSQWCRCLETAQLMKAGKVETLSALNNLFGRSELKPAQVREIRNVVEAWMGKGTLLLISHGSTIGALTGIYPSTAEGVVLAPAPGTAEGFRIVGRIGPEG